MLLYFVFVTFMGMCSGASIGQSDKSGILQTSVSQTDYGSVVTTSGEFDFQVVNKSVLLENKEIIIPVKVVYDVTPDVSLKSNNRFQKASLNVLSEAASEIEKEDSTGVRGDIEEDVKGSIKVLKATEGIENAYTKAISNNNNKEDIEQAVPYYQEELPYNVPVEIDYGNINFNKNIRNTEESIHVPSKVANILLSTVNRQKNLVPNNFSTTLKRQTVRSRGHVKYEDTVKLSLNEITDDRNEIPFVENVLRSKHIIGEDGSLIQNTDDKSVSTSKNGALFITLRNNKMHENIADEAIKKTVSLKSNINEIRGSTGPTPDPNVRWRGNRKFQETNGKVNSFIKKDDDMRDKNNEKNIILSRQSRLEYKPKKIHTDKLENRTKVNLTNNLLNKEIKQNYGSFMDAGDVGKTQKENYERKHENSTRVNALLQSREAIGEETSTDINMKLSTESLGEYNLLTTVIYLDETEKLVPILLTDKELDNNTKDTLNEDRQYTKDHSSNKNLIYVNTPQMEGNIEEIKKVVHNKLSTLSQGKEMINISQNDNAGRILPPFDESSESSDFPTVTFFQYRDNGEEITTTDKNFEITSNYYETVKLVTELQTDTSLNLEINNNHNDTVLGNTFELQKKDDRINESKTYLNSTHKDEDISDSSYNHVQKEMSFVKQHSLKTYTGNLTGFLHSDTNQAFRLNPNFSRNLLNQKQKKDHDSDDNQLSAFVELPEFHLKIDIKNESASNTTTNEGDYKTKNNNTDEKEVVGLTHLVSAHYIETKANATKNENGSDFTRNYERATGNEKVNIKIEKVEANNIRKMEIASRTNSSEGIYIKPSLSTSQVKPLARRRIVKLRKVNPIAKTEALSHNQSNDIKSQINIQSITMTNNDAATTNNYEPTTVSILDLNERSHESLRLSSISTTYDDSSEENIAQRWVSNKLNKYTTTAILEDSSTAYDTNYITNESTTQSYYEITSVANEIKSDTELYEPISINENIYRSDDYESDILATTNSDDVLFEKSTTEANGKELKLKYPLMEKEMKVHKDVRLHRLPYSLLQSVQNISNPDSEQNSAESLNSVSLNKIKNNENVILSTDVFKENVNILINEAILKSNIFKNNNPEKDIQESDYQVDFTARHISDGETRSFNKSEIISDMNENYRYINLQIKDDTTKFNTSDKTIGFLDTHIMPNASTSNYDGSSKMYINDNIVESIADLGNTDTYITNGYSEDFLPSTPLSTEKKISVKDAWSNGQTYASIDMVHDVTEQSTTAPFTEISSDMNDNYEYMSTDAPNNDVTISNYEAVLTSNIYENIHYREESHPADHLLSTKEPVYSGIKGLQTIQFVNLTTEQSTLQSPITFRSTSLENSHDNTTYQTTPFMETQSTMDSYIDVEATTPHVVAIIGYGSGSENEYTNNKHKALRNNMFGRLASHYEVTDLRILNQDNEGNVKFAPITQPQYDSTTMVLPTLDPEVNKFNDVLQNTQQGKLRGSRTLESLQSIGTTNKVELSNNYIYSRELLSKGGIPIDYNTENFDELTMVTSDEINISEVTEALEFISSTSDENATTQQTTLEIKIPQNLLPTVENGNNIKDASPIIDDKSSTRTDQENQRNNKIDLRAYNSKLHNKNDEETTERHENIFNIQINIDNLRTDTDFNENSIKVQLKATNSSSIREPVIGILSSDNRVYAYNGKFTYSYESADGSKAFETGKLKKVDKDHSGEAVAGGFSFNDSAGHNYAIEYTADENGYQPTGAHLPTPPPIPPAIARALEYLATKSTPAPVTESFT